MSPSASRTLTPLRRMCCEGVLMRNPACGVCEGLGSGRCCAWSSLLQPGHHPHTGLLLVAEPLRFLGGEINLSMRKVCKGDVPSTLTLHHGPNHCPETLPCFTGQATFVLSPWKRLGLTKESKHYLLVRLHRRPHSAHIPLGSGFGQRQCCLWAGTSWQCL